MAFNSISFILFFLLVFGLYWAWAVRKLNWRNAFILLASYGFYAAWDWRFLSLIFISSLSDYFLAQKIEKASKSIGRRYLIASLVINLGILASFKYYDFFAVALIDLGTVFGWQLSLPFLKIILPVGISFYTFQTLSYTIDVYRGQMKATSNYLAFFSYVAFFPQLVAGPIERAKRLLPQFEVLPQFDFERAKSACRLLLYGLFKKVVIADRMALLVDPVFAEPSTWSSPIVILAILAFGIQIYADFSAYSDIAIACARLLGIELMTNFRTPYLAKSLREFWQRWHISLSTWFRDYVYIPLGGNKVISSRWAFNILITFLLSGLWHGAAYTFLIWGSIHGMVLILERWIKIRWWSALAWLKTFVIVHLAWIFFRIENLGQLVEMRQGLLSWDMTRLGLDAALDTLFVSSQMAAAFGLVGLIFIYLEIGMSKLEPDRFLAKQPTLFRWGIYYLLFFAILFLGQFDNAPQFIYFQF